MSEKSNNSNECVDSVGETPTRQSAHDGQDRAHSSDNSRHREIHLSRGMVALVDEGDFDAVSTSRWSFQPNGRVGYAIRGVKREDGRYHSELMHRFILAAQPGTFVDHINGNGLDNRRCNLRLCTGSQNAANRQVVGATLCRKSDGWVARITHMGAVKWLGTFPTKAAAQEAYRQARIALFGEFAGKVV